MSTPLVLNYTVASTNTDWNGIPYLERANENWTATLSNNQNSTSTRKLICRWSDVTNFTDWLLDANGFYAPNGDRYYVGAQHPFFAGQFVDSVVVNPYTGVSTAESTFDYAETIVAYKSLPIEKPGDATAVREDTVELISQIITIPRASLQAISAQGSPYGKPMHTAHDVNTFLPILKITSTLLGVSRVPLGTIIATQNHLCSSSLSFAFGGTTYTIDGDTILYCGASSKRTVMSNGVVKYDVTHTFIVSPIHNKILDPTSTAGDLIARFILPPDSFQQYKKTSFAGLGV